MKWYLLFLLFLFIPLVNGIEYNVGTITDCVNDLNVSVTGLLPISDNEYSLKDCNRIQGNEWSCSCSKTIILDVANNAINNYTFTIKYTSQKIEKETRTHRGGSGGGSGGGYYYAAIKNESSITNQTLPINQSQITYPFYNITTEYKTAIFNVSPQPLNQPEPVVQTVPVIQEDKRTIWQQFIDILIKILHFKLW